MQIRSSQTTRDASEHGQPDADSSPHKATPEGRSNFPRRKLEERGRLGSRSQDESSPRNRVSLHGRKDSSDSDCAVAAAGATKRGSTSDSPTRRGSGGRGPIRIPYLAQIERRISTDLLDIAGKLDSLKPLPMLMRDLNKETTNYRQLTVGIGGSSDCDQLREELRRSRQRATDLAKQAKTKMLPSLQEPNRYSSNEQKDAAKFCKLLFYCVKVLEQEVTRSMALQNTFPLQRDNQSLINTGVNEFVGTHRSPVFNQFSETSSSDKSVVEETEILSLQKEASELWGYLAKLQSNCAGKYWGAPEDTNYEKHSLHTIFETSDPPSSPASPFTQQESNNSDQESQDGSSREKLHHRRCMCWILVSLVTTLAVASLLGLLISFLTS